MFLYYLLWVLNIEINLSDIFSGQGFVIPGNNKLGYLLYKERYYSISTVDRAEQFGRNPDLFIVAIKKLIRDSPCLLKLLNVTDEEVEEEESPSKYSLNPWIARKIPKSLTYFKSIFRY